MGGGRQVDGRWAGRWEVDAASDGCGEQWFLRVERLTVVGAAAVARIAGCDAERGGGDRGGEGEHVGECVLGECAERRSAREWSDDG